MDYNLIADRPKVEGRCDICGTGLITRADDTAEALEARLRDYYDKTRPVLELFRRKEVVHDVDARPCAADVQSLIRATLGLPPYNSSASETSSV
jgi:adenylate kinase